MLISSSIIFLFFMGLAVVSQPAGHNINNKSILSAAYAQIIIPDEDSTIVATTNLENDTQNASTFLLRGFIGSTVQIEEEDAGGDQANQTNQNDYVITGRWRLLVNETLVQRFVANMTVVKTDGSEPRNIVIENIPTRPGIERNGNITVAELDAKVYPSDDSDASITVPVQLEVIGNNVVRLVLDIDERMAESEDISQLGILRPLGGSAIYGSVEFREIQ
jgi:hypothetical protein